MRNCRSYLEAAWQFFSTVDRSLFPSDLMAVIPRDKRIEFIFIRFGEMARSLGTKGDRSSFLDTALNAAMDFTMAMRGGFFEYEFESLRLIASRNVDPSFITTESGKLIEQSLLDAVHESKEVILPMVKGAADASTKAIRKGGADSLISLPVVLGGHLYGYLYLDHPVDGATFRDDNLPYLRVLCDQIAVGLSNINMYNEMKELKERFEERRASTNRRSECPRR